MDDHTNDRDSGLPSGGSPEELEEALKWLEELTARQGKPAELSNPVPPASLDSPFRGLIDSDEGDLPDWLREVPSPPGSQGIGDGEPESRLDWLAKMAQRESIEELPTLEWRRLSEPVQSAILADHQTDIQPSTPEEIDHTDETDEAVVLPAETAAEEPATTESEVIEGIAELALPETTSTDEWVDSLAELSDSDSVGAQLAEDVAAELEGGEHEPTTTNWETGDHFSSLDDEELPPLDDLDAAMAWIEELAVSQEGPIEEIPSVADRALASKLMAEAGLPASMSNLDEIGSDSELVNGLTPTHPFIEEEDFADTVVLVETLAADEGRSPSPESDMIESAAVDIQDEAAVVSSFDEEQFRSVTEDLGEITTFEESAAPSPDDIEFPESALPEETDLQEDEESTTEPSLPADTPVDSPDQILTEEVDEFAVDEVASVEAYELSGDALSFEEAMAYLDEIAVPPIEPVVEDSDRLDAEDIAAAALIASVTGSEEETEAADDIGDSEIVDAEIVSITESIVEDSDEIVGELSEPDEPEPISVDDFESANWEELPVESPNGYADLELEEALTSLDALALPPGRSLDEIDLTLRTAQVTPWRDVNSALDWLESNLVAHSAPVHIQPAALDEEELIAQMPEDPDAVLAWLEQLAADENEQPSAYEAIAHPAEGTAVRGEPLIEEQAEADLLNMPDDPDEAMLWLESLAREGRPSSEPFQPVDDEVVDSIDNGLRIEIDAVEEEIVVPGEFVEQVEPTLTVEELHEVLAESSAAELVTEQPGESFSVGEQEDGIIEAAADEVEDYDTVMDDEPSLTDVEIEETQAGLPTQETTAPAKRRQRKPAKPKAELESSPEEPAPSEPDAISWVDLLKPLD